MKECTNTCRSGRFAVPRSDEKLAGCGLNDEEYVERMVLVLGSSAGVHELAGFSSDGETALTRPLPADA
jgi:hypothetical protein